MIIGYHQDDLVKDNKAYLLFHVLRHNGSVIYDIGQTEKDLALDLKVELPNEEKRD